MTNPFIDFVAGYNFGDSIVNRKREREWEDKTRARQEEVWSRQDIGYQEAREAEAWTKLANRYRSIALKPDGTEKKWEEMTNEDRRGYQEILNAPEFAKVRDVHGMKAQVTDVRGRGSEIMVEVEHRDPESGKVVSRGVLSENRFGNAQDPQGRDPARKLTIGGIGQTLDNQAAAAAAQYEAVQRELRAQVPSLNDASLKAAAFGQRQRDHGVMADYVIDQAQGGAATGTPGASPSREYVEQGLIKRGMSPMHAVGATANVGKESSFNPGAVGDGGNSVGLFQWNGPRRQALQEFAKARGKDWKDVDTQLDYMMTEPDTKAYLQKSFNSPVEAASAFTLEWERPKAEYAKSRIAEFQNDPYLTRQPAAATDPSIAAATPSVVQQTGAPPGTPGPMPSLADGMPARAAREEALFREMTREQLMQERDAAAAAAAPQVQPTLPNSPANQDAVREYAGALLDVQRSGNVAGGNYAPQAKARLATAAKAIPPDIRARIDANPAAALRGTADIVGATGVPQVTQNPEAAARVKSLTAELAELAKLPDTPEQQAVDQKLMDEAVKQATEAPALAVKVPPEVIAAYKREILRDGNATPEELEALDRLVKTGQLWKRDIKIFGSSSGSVTAVDAGTGQVVSSSLSEPDKMYQEARLFEKQKALRAQQPGTPEYEAAQLELQKKRYELGASKYGSDKVKALAKSEQFWWSGTGEKGKHNEDEVEADILLTMANERDTLAALGFPADSRAWTQQQYDAFLGMWKASRRGDRIVEGPFSNQKIDTRGTLNKTLLRDLGPKSPVMSVGNQQVDLNKVVAFVKQKSGQDITLEQAAALVKQYSGGRPQ